MDSNRFGVTLKSTGLGDKKERERKKYTPARKNQFSNMKDIKNMFESGIGDKSEDVRVPSNFGTDYKERKFTTQRSITKSESNKADSKNEEDLALFSQIKFNIDVNKNTSLERTYSSGSVGSPRSSRKETRDLDATTNGSPRASRRMAKEDDCTAEPCVVKSKVMSGGSYQASVDNKLQRVNSQEDKMQVDKKMATSALIGNLSILRTRPGSGGNSKKTDSPMPTNNDSVKTNGIFNTSSNLQKDPWKKSNSSSDSVSSSKDLPWVKSSSDSKESSSNITNYGNRDSSATKEIKDRKSKDLNSSSSPKSVDKSGAPFDFSLSYTKKPDDSVSSGSVYSRQSSVESMASEKSSPRSSLKSSNKLQLDHSNVSDTTSSGSLSPRVRQFSPESKPDDKPEWMDKSKELVNKFQTKLKKPVISDFSVIVTTSSASSSSSKTTISSSTTKTTSTWTPKSTSPAKSESVSKTSSTFSKTTTQRPSSGQSEEALKDRVPFVKSVSGSKEPKLSSETDGKVDIKEKQYLSRKISSETFQKLKGGFEQSDDNSKLSGQHKPKIDIKVTKNFIERKNSFEKLDTQVSMTKSKTLKNLQAEGKMLGIKERINALNEGKGEIPDQKSKQKSQLQRSEEVTGPHEEYNDIEGFEVYKEERSNDWPSDFSDSDGDNMYEYIPATDPEKQEDNLVCSLRRKPGQKRKGNNRPSFDKDLTLDSSPEVTTEGSSRDGTLESTEDGTGIEADVEEYDSDGSGSSGVYEPIDPDWQDHLKSSPDPASQGDTPPDLPPGRNRHKKKKEGGKTIGRKFKKLKEKLASNPDKQKDEGIPKVSSTSSLASNSSSSGLLKKMGKMMKKPKQGANQEKFVEDSEELGICQSDSSDMNDNVYEDEPIQMHKVQSEEDNSGSDIYEQHMDRDFDHEPEKSPIPPRPSLPPPAPPPAPPVPPRLSLPPMSNKDEPPPRPPSTGRSPISKENNNMPALPPRNRISTSFNLDTVVPISPGLSGPTWHPSQDSYLHGHRVKGSDFHDHRDGSGSSSSSDEANQGMVRTNAQDYLEPDPPVKGRSMIVRDNSVPEEPAPPIPPPPVIRHREKELLDKRPSSGYASFKPYQSMNAVTAPFDDLLNYKSQLEFDSSGEDQLYFDLSDDQLYGTLDRRFTSKFTSEPLYQCYHRDKVTRSSARHTEMTLSDDEEEEIPISKPDRGERIYEAVEDIELDDDKPKSNSKLSTLDMFGKSGSVLRALWCEMPEVKESGILDKVSPQERKIQEAMFEIITSEASYLKSLNVLINVFLMSPEFSEESELSDRCVITRQERHVLFSNIGAVRETSEKFLCDLEARWQKSVFLSDICDIIYQHAANKFECYVRYCTNQTFQERAVQELQKRPEICEIIKKLERTPECQGLPMISFLLLPMQRITRLPLLVDAICHRLEPNTDKHKSACRAMDALSRVVKKCNDGAKKMQQTEQMCHLVRNLEFKVKEIPLISASRFLVKQGELTRIMTESSSRLPFGKRNSSKQPIYVFLFNDMLVVSKRKNNNTYVVTDYAKRNTLHVENIDSPEKSKLLPNGVPSGCKNLFMVVLLENHEQRQVEMIFSCKSPSDRTRWIDALSPTNKESDNEKIYEEWDCPQVQCLQRYHATEPDELTIEESDVINVFKKMGDGWYEGERIRDGEKGWFPSTCVEEIVNSHVRSRNLRLRYRLMLASQDYGDLSLRAGLNKA